MSWLLRWWSSQCLPSVALFVQSRHIVAGEIGTWALLLRLGRRCLRLDVLYASTSPEAIELRVTVITLHGFEGNKVTVLDAAIAVGAEYPRVPVACEGRRVHRYEGAGDSEIPEIEKLYSNEYFLHH